MWLIYIYICIYIYMYIYISVDECLIFFYHSPLKNAARSPRSWHVPGSNHGLKKGYQRTHFLLSFKPHEISQTGLKHLFSLKYPKIMKIALETPWRICLIANPDGEYSKNVFVRRPEYMTGTWALTIAQIALWSKENVYSNPRIPKR